MRTLAPFVANFLSLYVTFSCLTHHLHFGIGQENLHELSPLVVVKCLNVLQCLACELPKRGHETRTEGGERLESDRVQRVVSV